MASRRDVAVSVLQYGLGLAALAFLLTRVDFGTVADRLQATSPAALTAICAVTVAGVVSRFDTWRAVVAPFQRVGLLTAGRVDLAVNFVNQLLPSRLSGRLAAPFILRAETGMDYGDATAAAGAHTGIYAVCYGIVSLVGVGVIVGRVSTGLLLVLLLSTGLYLVAGVVVLLAGLNLTVLDRIVGVFAGLAAGVPRVGTAIAARIRSVPDVTAASGRFVCVSTSPSGTSPRRPTPPIPLIWSRPTSMIFVSPLCVTSMVTVPPGSLRVLKLATPTKTLHMVVAAPTK